MKIIAELLKEYPHQSVAKGPFPDVQQQTRLAAIEKYKVDQADQRRRDAIEGQLVVKDREDFAGARAAFVRENPQASFLELDVLDAHHALEIAKRVVARNPNKLHRVMGDGSLQPHANVVAVKVAEERLKAVIERYRFSKQQIETGAIVAVPAFYEIKGGQ